jgi:imidazolonepropionase-like amidohydrolase
MNHPGFASFEDPHRKNFLIWIGLLFLFLRVGLFAQDSVTKTDTFAFVNITVLPMDEDRELKNATVLVRRGRIIDVDFSRKVEVPEGATVIDGKGLYLMPGLADMHVHLGNESDMKLFLANGVTTIRNMRGSPIHIFWRDKIESGELLGPRVITAGPILDGSPPSGENVVSVQSPEDARALVEQQKKAGYDFIKIYTRLSVPVYQEILKAAKENGMKVAGHVPRAVGLSMAMSEKQDCVEHLTGFMSAIRVHDWKMSDSKGVIDTEQIPFLADVAHDQQVWNCVTLIVQQRFASVNHVNSLMKLPEMKYVSPMRMAFWDPSKDPNFKSISQEEYDSALEGVEVLKTITKTLQNHGAKILLGTDSPSRFVVPGFSAHEELENLVDSGLTPYEALRAATANAAAFLDKSSDFGSVEKGRSADFLILRANPMQDIKNTREIYGVMARGNWIPQDRIQEMLEEVIQSFQSPKNQFSTVPEPASDSDPLFKARYIYSYGNVPIGEERIKVYSLKDNQEKIVAQHLIDTPFPSLFTVETTQKIGESNQKTISFRSNRPEGEGELSIVQNKGSLRIEGKLPYMDDIHYIAAGPENRLFGTSEISSRFLLHSQLDSLKIGQSVSFSTMELDFGEVFSKGFSLIPAIWKVTRKSDGEMKIAESTVPVHFYQAEITTKYGMVPGVLVLDGKGRPVKFSKGAWQFQRVE